MKKVVLKLPIISCMLGLSLTLLICSQVADNLRIDYRSSGIDYYVHAKYDSAVYFFKKAVDGYQKKYQWDSVVSLAKFYGRALDRVNKHEDAVSFLDYCSTLQRKYYPDDSLMYAAIKDEAGSFEMDYGNLQSGLRILNEVLAVRKRHTNADDTLWAESYDNISFYYLYSKDYDKARFYLDSALSIRAKWQGIESRPYIITLFNHATTLFHMSEYQKALADFKKVDSVFTSLYGRDYPALAIVYNNLSSIYGQMGDDDLKASYLEKAIEINRRTGNKNALAINLNNLSLMYLLMGDYQQALLYAREGLVIIEENKEQSAYLLPNIYDQISGIYLSMGHNAEALEYTEKAYRAKLLIYDSISIPVAWSFFNFGTAYQYMNLHEKALEYFMKSAVIRKKIAGGDSEFYADCISSMASSYVKLGNPDKALALFAVSSGIYKRRTGIFSNYYLSDISGIGEILFLNRDYTACLDSANRVIQLASRNRWKGNNIFDNPSIDSVKHSDALITALMLKARCLRDLFCENRDTTYINAAIETWKLAIADFEKSYRGYGGLDNRPDLLNSAVGLFQEVISAYTDKYELTGDSAAIASIFEYGEQSKAFVLRDILRHQRAMSFSGVPDSLVGTDQKLKNKLIGLNESPKEDDIDYLKTLNDTQNKLDSIQHVFETRYPDYARLRYDIEPVALGELQKKLNENTSVIEFCRGVDRVYLLCITRDKVAFHPMASHYTYEDMVGRLNHSLQKQQSDVFVRISDSLYKETLGPVKPFLKENIVWIPDGVFHLLNPEILTEAGREKSAPAKFSDLPYLVYKYTFRVEHSATIMCQRNTVHKQPVTSKYDILGFAPFNSLSGNDMAGKNRQTDDPGYKTLIRQPWAGEALKTIDKDYDAHSFYDRSATKENFISHVEEAKIIHLGTHAVMDNKEPLKSRLVFGIPEGGDKEKYLYAYEVYNMRLPSELTVLTACETGNGVIRPGEGVISVARAFSYAGCPSVVMSLWSIDDQTTSGIISSFYKYLKKGMPKSEALRHAKTDFLKGGNKTFFNPYYWSGLVLIGEDSPVDLGGGYLSAVVWVVGSLVLLVMAGLIFSYWKRKPKPVA